MFLALREIKREKLRYGLVIAMIVLISYLLFMLVGLMDGLSNENTAAIESWDAKTVWLNKDGNDRLNSSFLTQEQVDQLPRNKHTALVGDQGTKIALAKKTNRHAETIQFVGLDDQEFIVQSKVKLTSGHQVKGNHQLVLDDSLKEKGYRLGDKVKLTGSSDQFTVVGFAKDAKINIAPVAYGTLKTWQKMTGNRFVASAVFSDHQSKETADNVKRYSVSQFINKLPGYTAQNATLQMMIGFLLVISLVVIAVFLYILTMQKQQHYALLRAQGIPSKMLISATIWQSLLLMVAGLVIAILLTLATVQAMPTTVPVLLKGANFVWMSAGMVLIGIVGSLLPALMIIRIDPLDALR